MVVGFEMNATQAVYLEVVRFLEVTKLTNSVNASGQIRVNPQQSVACSNVFFCAFGCLSGDVGGSIVQLKCNSTLDLHDGTSTFDCEVLVFLFVVGPSTSKVKYCL